MADVHDKKTRSFNMSMIKGSNTKPEVIVRKFLHRNGFRYKLNDKTLPGGPDIVLPKYKSVVFVNGCFWHAHKECKYFKIPKTRTEFWEEKLFTNRLRDIKNNELLTTLGWHVFTVWECELKEKLEETLSELKRSILRQENTLQKP